MHTLYSWQTDERTHSVSSANIYKQETCVMVFKKTGEGKRKEKTKIIAAYTSTSPKNIHFLNSCKWTNSLKTTYINKIGCHTFRIHLDNLGRLKNISYICTL